MLVAAAAVVFIKDYKRKINQFYFLNTALIIILNYFNYLSLKPVAMSIIYIRAVLALSTLIIGIFYLTSYFFDKEKIKLSLLQIVYLIATFFVALLDLTDKVFKSVHYGKIFHLHLGPLVAIFLLHAAITLIITSLILIQRIKKTRGRARQQYQYLLIGLVPAFLSSALTSFILPYYFHNPSFIVITPIYIELVYAMIGLSIIFNGLFDLRFYLYNAVINLLIVIIADVLLSIPFLLLIDWFFKLNLALHQFMIASLILLIPIFLYPFIIKIFRKATGQFFFNDYYDSEEFMAGFNNLIISNFDVHSLVRRASDYIKDNLKIDFIEFYIEDEIVRQNLKKIKQISQRDIDFLNKYLPHTKETLINLEADERIMTGNLHNNFNDKISLVIPLNSYFDGHKEYLGFYIFSNKKSNQTYNSRDLRVINSITDVLIVAIQNLLHYEEIKNLNLNLQDKINAATSDLRRSNEKLRQLDESKDDFISMASHQLRTPLTSVKGYLSMVLEGDAGKITNMQKNMLNQAFFSAQKMVYLVADLLNVSRIKTGKFMIEPTRVNLAVLVDQEMKQLIDTADARGIKLIYDRPETFPELMLDETKIRQVIMNFIDNAIYYTLSGGTARIIISESDKTVEFKVKDNGIGVTKSEQPHLFTKFYRASNARKVRPDGTGLGLYMAKKVIMAEEGSIIFESAEGKGSTFGFILSKSKLAVPKK